MITNFNFDYALITVFTIAFVVGGMAVSYLFQKANINTRSIAVLSAQINPFWARVQEQAASDLHHPHPRYAETDALLEKLERSAISIPDLDRLKALLQDRSVDTHEEITPKQRLEAKIMISGLMELVVIEAASPRSMGQKQPGDGDRIAK